MAINVYASDTHEYENLKMAAALMTVASPKGWHYEVGETYFDLGQDWKWTTIICDGGFQALYPPEQEQLCLAETVADILAVLQQYFKRTPLDK